ncbi:NAAT family transporter [bacterium]|nr:NAAT family transporter [bacterium]
MQLWNDYFRLFIGILAIVNPIGAIPVILGATEGQDRAARRRTVKTASLTVLCTLLAVTWIGHAVLNFFGIGIPAFRVGGGILILMMSISMLYARPNKFKHGPDEARYAHDSDSVGVVPIGIPLLSGPGSIALVIVETQRIPGLGHQVLMSLAVLLVGVTVWVVLSLSDPIGRRLGRTGINIATRLMGLLLAAIAVEFIAAGALELFPGLG